MKSRFYRTLKIVALVHVGALVLLLLTTGLPRWLKREATVVPIEFMVELPAPEPEPEVSVPERPPEPEPEPPAPEPEPEPEPLPAPPPPEPRRAPIERSQVKVRREIPVRQPQRTLSPEEIRRRLQDGAVAGDRTTPIPDGDARYFRIVYRVLYDAWTQPSTEAVGGAQAIAAITLASGGRLAGRRLATGSGNAEMDASVRAALEAVARVPGLDEGFIERHPEITIAFKVE